MALTRVTGICPQHRNDESPAIDTAMQARLLDAVLSIDMSNLDATVQLTLQRTIQIILNRFGRPDNSTVEKLSAAIDPLFPSNSADLNWLLCETLAYLQAPSVAS